MNKNKLPIIALAVSFLLGVFGGTVAYYSGSAQFTNEFQAAKFKTKTTENFTAPTNWRAGEEIPSTFVTKNEGTIPVAVRASYSERWENTNGDPLNISNAVTINFSHANRWTKIGNYFYYKYVLKPGEETKSFIKSVTLNDEVGDVTCTSSNNGLEQVCETTGSAAGKKYILSINIETIDIEQYEDIWSGDLAGSNFTVTGKKNKEFLVEHIMDNANAATVTSYASGTKANAYTFNHAKTNQTKALTDYRYIGNEANNYIYFNCDTTPEATMSGCQVWRIIGVFPVQDENGNWDDRVKIIPNSISTGGYTFGTGSSWDVSSNGKTIIDNWYSSNSLSSFSKNYIAKSKIYLGTVTTYSSNAYDEERSNTSNYMANAELMYPSDYIYTFALGIDDTCFNNNGNCQNASKSWLYNMDNSGLGWLLNYYNTNPTHNFIAVDGYIYHGDGSSQSSTLNAFYTLYLKSDTYIYSGDGSQSSPYAIY